MHGHHLQGVVRKAFALEGLHGISDQKMESLANRIATLADNLYEPMNRKACAALLGVSLPTLDGYISEGTIPRRVKNPHSKKRKHYVFYKHEVLDWFPFRFLQPR